jgi:hypothetical protein
MTVRGLGWIPDLPDIRDEKYTYKLALRHEIQEELPVRAMVCWHFTDKCPARNVDELPVFNQGATSSCTGQSTGNMIDLISGLRPRSRLELYWLGREAIGQTNLDQGAYLRDVIKGIADVGAGAEEYWPFDEKKVLTKPSAKVWESANKHKINTYNRLQNRQDYKSCLAAGFPFVIGFTCYEDFVSSDSSAAKVGIQNYPDGKSSLAGGHAVCVIGYDDDFRNSDWGKQGINAGVFVPSKVYIIRNSWGKDWGHKGNFAIDAAYLENVNLADDAWTVRYVKNSS